MIKAKKGRTTGKKYLVKLENVYKALPNTKTKKAVQNEVSEYEEEELKTKRKFKRITGKEEEFDPEREWKCDPRREAF